MNIETDTQQILSALIGGTLIGLSVTLMLWFKGVVTGISGITYNLLVGNNNGRAWRASFVLGLLVGGVLLLILAPESFNNHLELSTIRLVIAGILVGFGTVLGNGCTSGHGVCGISRFSLRSISATITFMLFGILTVAIWGGV